MQLTCPSCGSRYRIDASSWPTEHGPDGAVILRARKVRCKVCRDVWQAVPEEEALELENPLPPEDTPRPAAWASVGGWPEPRPVDPPLRVPPPVFAAPMVLSPVPPPPLVPRSSFPPSAFAPPNDPPLHFERPPGLAPSPAAARAAAGRPRIPGPGPQTQEEPEDDQVVAAPPEDDWQPPEDDYTPDDYADEDEDDRPRRRWPWVLGALAVAGSLFALVATGRVHPEDYGLPAYNPAALPGWADPSRIGLPSVAVPRTPPPPLTLKADAARRSLAGGRTVWEVRGTVTNPTQRRLPVPPVELLLIDAGNQIVGRWTVRPGLENLAPGGTARFETSAIDPPPSAVRLRLQLKPGGLGQV